MSSKPVRHCLMFAAALAGIGSMANACAASGDGMLGDWGGLRTKWLADGVDVQATYKSQTAWNPSGGKDQGARYADQWQLAASFDLGKLASIAGGKLYAALTNRDGRNLTDDRIGNLMQVQGVYRPQHGADPQLDNARRVGQGTVRFASGRSGRTGGWPIQVQLPTGG